VSVSKKKENLPVGQEQFFCQGLGPATHCS